jgi:hypothetical protein
LCGIDCADDDRLTRHVSWAHPGAWTARVEKKDQPAGAGTKV